MQSVSTSGDGPAQGHALELTSSRSSNFHAIALLDEEMSFINNEIKRLEARHRDIRTERNGRQLISSLPSEILLKIFFILRSLSDESVFLPTPYWDWIIVTWVCRYWRELALGTASLWNIIIQMYDIKRIRIFLERSKGLDIEVSYYDALPPKKSKIRQLVRQNLVRVRRLRFKRIVYNDRGDTVENWISDPGPMPRLKELRVDIRSGELSSTDFLEDWVPTTQLEVLELSLRGTQWNHPMFRGLKALLLSEIDYDVGPSLEELIFILENCSDIRELQLYEVRLRASGDNGRYDTRSIHLRCLRKFTLVSRYALDRDIYLSLMGRLHFKPSDRNKFCFQVKDNRTTPQYSQKPLAFPILPQCVRSLISDCDSRHKMIILSISRVEATLHVYRDLAVRKLNQHRNILDSPLYFSVISDFDELAEESVAILFQQDCIRNVSNLCLQFDYKRVRHSAPAFAFKTDVWIHIFEAVPHLKQIEFLHGLDGSNDEDLEWIMNFVTAFIQPKAVYIGSQNYHCLDLHEMLFAQVDFSIEPVEDVFLKLLDHLEFRRNDGHELRKLWLASCKGTEILLAKKPNISEIVHELSLNPLPQEFR